MANIPTQINEIRNARSPLPGPPPQEGEGDKV